jgi:hypothetical protein
MNSRCDIYLMCRKTPPFIAVMQGTQFYKEHCEASMVDTRKDLKKIPIELEYLKNTPIKLGFKRVPQPSNAYLAKLPADLHQNFIDPCLNLEKDHKRSAGLARSSIQLYSIYQPALNKQYRPQLFQAVVDGDIEIVKRILDTNLGLLLDKPKEDLVIQSQLTWDIFNFKDENVFTIAAKRRQIKILELLSSYLNKLQDHTLIEITKKEVLSKWPSYEHKEKKGKFDIPADYIVELNRMVNVFNDETFPNGTEVNAKISKETELALGQFRDKILPRKAATLDESIQPELFLYAALKIYDDCFFDFKSWNQRDAYCKEIVGPAQRRLTREDAIPWCEGIYYVVEENRAISDHAGSLKLGDDKNFYLAAPDFAAGLGGKYFCDSDGNRADVGLIGGTPHRGRVRSCHLKKLFQAKTAACRDLCEALTIAHALKIV